MMFTVLLISRTDSGASLRHFDNLVLQLVLGQRAD